MNKQYDINIENSRPKMVHVNANINQNPYINQSVNPLNTQPLSSASGFNSGDFIKGALLGAALTYLLTNKAAQETALKAFGKGSELFTAGIEELKERYEDMKAQMQTHQE